MSDMDAGAGAGAGAGGGGGGGGGQEAEICSCACSVIRVELIVDCMYAGEWGCQCGGIGAHRVIELIQGV